jgi:hypothetical protein
MAKRELSPKANREAMVQRFLGDIEIGRLPWPKVVVAVGRILHMRHVRDTGADPDAMWSPGPVDNEFVERFLRTCDRRQLKLLREMVKDIEEGTAERIQ